MSEVRTNPSTILAQVSYDAWFQQPHFDPLEALENHCRAENRRHPAALIGTLLY
jgi:hypothetical protein